MEKVVKIYLIVLILSVMPYIVGRALGVESLIYYYELTVLVLITIFLFGVVYFIWKH